MIEVKVEDYCSKKYNHWKNKLVSQQVFLRSTTHPVYSTKRYKECERFFPELLKRLACEINIQRSISAHDCVTICAVPTAMVVRM